MYKKRRKKTHTHNSPAVPTYCIDVTIIIMQKNIFYLFFASTTYKSHCCAMYSVQLWVGGPCV